MADIFKLRQKMRQVFNCFGQFAKTKVRNKGDELPKVRNNHDGHWLMRLLKVGRLHDKEWLFMAKKLRSITMSTGMMRLSKVVHRHDSKKRIGAEITNLLCQKQRNFLELTKLKENVLLEYGLAVPGRMEDQEFLGDAERKKYG